ncbi:hypothetical protein [Actinokineospora sp.]|uniref:hypothetical protein n=1 Tax=Actinokineospora sp. TaxID=1872133 RepID=UPI004037E6AE
MRRLVVAEFQKLFASRLWLWLLLGAGALTALYASLAIAFGDDPDNPSPPLSTAQGQGLVFGTAQGAATLVAVLGAIGLTAEFRHRTVTASFLATPRRGRLVVAKLITYAAAGVLYSLFSIGVMLAIAVPWLSAKGIDVTLDGKADILVGVVAGAAIFGIIGVGLGALLREQVATVVGLLIYLFVVEPIVTRISALGEWTRFLPGAAEEALTQVVQANQRLLEPWQGGLVLLAYGVVFAIAGTLLSVRRDVS